MEMRGRSLEEESSRRAPRDEGHRRGGGGGPQAHGGWVGVALRKVSQEQEEGVKNWVELGGKEGPGPRERCPRGRCSRQLGETGGLRQDPGAGGCGDSGRQKAVSVSPGGTPGRLLASRAAQWLLGGASPPALVTPTRRLISHVLPG